MRRNCGRQGSNIDDRLPPPDIWQAITAAARKKRKNAIVSNLLETGTYEICASR
ncbi:hypothetical protein [Brucella endophytica]|uniref:hypothetical protein n=1 Tax=Brucella endophytica TaxID=1963359 RepID=UPI00166DF23D|nr:hypothetical protein [Brucella endophytica]